MASWVPKAAQDADQQTRPQRQGGQYTGPARPLLHRVWLHLRQTLAEELLDAPKGVVRLLNALGQPRHSVPPTA